MPSPTVSATLLANLATATTDPQTGLTSSGVSLNGIVNPNGLATTVSFEWGTTTGYGNITSDQSIGSGAATASLLFSPDR